MKLKTKYNRDLSMVQLGQREGFTLEWTEGGFTEIVPLAWAPERLHKFVIQGGRINVRGNRMGSNSKSAQTETF